MNNNSYDIEVATLATGCFWCSEAVFRRVKGVKSVLPGYSGGTVGNPSYEEVCGGKTGHAESIQIEFDPKVISFEKIPDIFGTRTIQQLLIDKATMLVHSTDLQSFSIIKHKRRLPRN
jgi:peptide methionine sulfoxide reductase MsrA